MTTPTPMEATPSTNPPATSVPSATPAEPIESFALLGQLRNDEKGTSIPVPINYDIIRLFSEGLYQSPHKAIEELVSNSFDAGAHQVFVLLPRQGDDAPAKQDSLWVIDDGSGMDANGFKELWRVAESGKAAQTNGADQRRPIGQFGIGKLASYVLAWRLTHVSKVDNVFRYTSMDFRKVTGRFSNETPVSVALYEVDEAEAKSLLSEIEKRDPKAWDVMFGPEAKPAWTAAALSDFRDLMTKLRSGMLGWVLRTGLPLISDFEIFLNGTRLESPKIDYPVIVEVIVGGSGSSPDDIADGLGFESKGGGVAIPGLGIVTGVARLYEKPLEGKSEARGRSRGFFIKVRGRVINLDDELFGADAYNHSAWSRFAMEVHADGLRDHLLSSREGVRETPPVDALRSYLHGVFNKCRNAWEREQVHELIGLDIKTLLATAPASLASDPLLESVRSQLTEDRAESYYIQVPTDLKQEAIPQWLTDYEAAAKQQPFASLDIEPGNPYQPPAAYDAASRTLRINEAHPFVSKLVANSKNKTPATLFGSSEILTDALLREVGVDAATAIRLFELRDRALRILAGEGPADLREALRILDIADTDEDALEVAVGRALSTIGFKYARKGGKKGGTDGVLEAILGRQGETLADFKLVYDAKTTGDPSVAADKVDLGSLFDFCKVEKADFGFIVAKSYEGEKQLDSKIFRKIQVAKDDGKPITVLWTKQIKRLVDLHLKYGVTLSRVRNLFETCWNFTEVDTWLDALETDLARPEARVPLGELLKALEGIKSDALARPSIDVARTKSGALLPFEPERLKAALLAVQELVGNEWLEVDPLSNYVTMHTSASEIINRLNQVKQESS